MVLAVLHAARGLRSASLTSTPPPLWRRTAHRAASVDLGGSPRHREVLRGPTVPPHPAAWGHLVARSPVGEVRNVSPACPPGGRGGSDGFSARRSSPAGFARVQATRFPMKVIRWKTCGEPEGAPSGDKLPSLKGVTVLDGGRAHATASTVPPLCALGHLFPFVMGPLVSFGLWVPDSSSHVSGRAEREAAAGFPRPRYLQAPVLQTTEPCRVPTTWTEPLPLPYGKRGHAQPTWRRRRRLFWLCAPCVQRK